jgi:hypothetical protein
MTLFSRTALRGSLALTSVAAACVMTVAPATAAGSVSAVRNDGACNTLVFTVRNTTNAAQTVRVFWVSQFVVGGQTFGLHDSRVKIPADSKKRYVLDLTQGSFTSAGVNYAGETIYSDQKSYNC